MVYNVFINKDFIGFIKEYFMSEYIKTVKKVLLLSNEIALIFQNKNTLVWYNKKGEVLAESGVVYSDFIMKDEKIEGDSYSYNAELHKDGKVYSGKCTEIYEESIIYSVVVIDCEDILIKAFEDEGFLNYVQYHDAFINISITQISAYIDLIRDVFKGNKEVEIYCQKVLQNCMRIMKTVKDNSHLIEAINTKTDNTQKVVDVCSMLEMIVCNVPNVFNCKIKKKFSDKSIYIVCNEKDFLILMLNVLRYIAICSGTSNLKIIQNKELDNYLNISIVSFKNNDNIECDTVSKNMFISFDLEKLIIDKISEKMGVKVKMEKNKGNMSISLKFKMDKDLPPQLREPERISDNGRFSLFKVMFYDIHNKE